MGRIRFVAFLRRVQDRLWPSRVEREGTLIAPHPTLSRGERGICPTHVPPRWIPAFAGKTMVCGEGCLRIFGRVWLDDGCAVHECFGFGAVVGGEGYDGVAVPAVDDVQALYVYARILKASGYFCERARLVLEPENE